MNIKKNMIVAIMITFCFTATLFMAIPIRSVNQSTSQPDPWADVSGTTPGVPDGITNMKDIAYEVAHFNENVSNLTRDVNVTNWPTMQPEPAYKIIKIPAFNISWTFGVAYWSYDLIYVGGFGKAFVLIDPVPGVASPGYYTVSSRLDSVW